ncbi:hypothetical protein KCP78_21705 [Salmonella enterica subsp. enterica]|nr:hypothetical protein KCP78_21705 [Salmonella enterica subsp. enterica]
MNGSISSQSQQANNVRHRLSPFHHAFRRRRHCTKMRSAFGIHCFRPGGVNRCCRGRHRSHRRRWLSATSPLESTVTSSEADCSEFPARSTTVTLQRYHHSVRLAEGSAIRALRRLIDARYHAIMRHVYGHPGHISASICCSVNLGWCTRFVTLSLSEAPLSSTCCQRTSALPGVLSIVTVQK